MDPTRATQPEEVASPCGVLEHVLTHPQRRIVGDALYARGATCSVCHGQRLLDHDPPHRIVLGVLNFLLNVKGQRMVLHSAGPACSVIFFTLLDL